MKLNLWGAAELRKLLMAALQCWNPLCFPYLLLQYPPLHFKSSTRLCSRQQRLDMVPGHQTHQGPLMPDGELSGVPSPLHVPAAHQPEHFSTTRTTLKRQCLGLTRCALKASSSSEEREGSFIPRCSEL